MKSPGDPSSVRPDDPRPRREPPVSKIPENRTVRLPYAPSDTGSSQVANPIFRLNTRRSQVTTPRPTYCPRAGVLRIGHGFLIDRFDPTDAGISTWQVLETADASRHNRHNEPKPSFCPLNDPIPAVNNREETPAQHAHQKAHVGNSARPHLPPLLGLMCGARITGTGIAAVTYCNKTSYSVTLDYPARFTITMYLLTEKQVTA